MWCTMNGDSNKTNTSFFFDAYWNALLLSSGMITTNCARILSISFFFLFCCMSNLFAVQSEIRLLRAFFNPTILFRNFRLTTNELRSHVSKNNFHWNSLDFDLDLYFLTWTIALWIDRQVKSCAVIYNGMHTIDTT